jgi:hypothetical protein
MVHGSYSDQRNFRTVAGWRRPRLLHEARLLGGTMFARPEDLLTLAGHGGRLFEELLFDLVVAEGSRHGIPPADVHWDHRTSRPDGGRDIVVVVEHTDPAPRFVPRRRSLWSAKSGMDGLKPATLRAELLGHTAVRQHLQGGDPYVWCTLQPIDEDGRTALREKATEVSQAADGFRFNPALVEFRTLSDLCAVLKDHSGLIAKHLPDVARVFEGVHTLTEWQRRDRLGFAVPWVDFAARSQVIDSIQAHLRARSGPNVLHLAGLSGVGKTRTVLEACRGQRDLQAVWYVPRLTAFGDPFLRHLTRNENQLALVVVDEVPLEGWQTFVSQVEDHARRLRFVTVGPAHRNERNRPSTNLLVLAEPETDGGVLEVVRQAGNGLSAPVLESIARHSAHDLRLALMLVEATRGDGAFRDLPIANGREVWHRVTSLFRSGLQNPDAFQAHYPLLTVGIDIGVRGEHQRELEYVAAQFVVPAARLYEAAAAAVPCGLGEWSPSFFEATPRALAGHLFRDWVWGGLRLRLSAFLGGLPDRLLRRFVERCQDCTGDEREEIEAALAEFFRAELGDPDVNRLIDRQRSRLFKAWAELDPRNGLAWLREAVRRASEADLGALDGATDGSGGWRGRRQVVWLCEALASFGEQFWACEEILHRLAQVETEPAIGNNSTAIWIGMFHPALGLTEVPFPQRADLLLRRLREADRRTLPFVLSAVVDALGVESGRMMPPSVVGGRLTPEPWRPATYDVLWGLQQDLGRRALAAVSGLAPELQGQARLSVIRNLRVFASHGLLPELRALLDVDGGLRQAVRLELHRVVTWRERARAHRPTAPPDPMLEALRAWSDELAPTDLPARVKELTAMRPWDATRGDRREPDPYALLAGEALRQPDVMWQLTDWFNSDGPQSALPFGHALGQADAEDAIAPTAATWLEGGLCRGLVAGYLRGVAGGLGGLPVAWSVRLDRSAERHAEYVAVLTLDADCTRAGFRRVMGLFAADKIPLGYLGGFSSPNWESVLGVADRAEILNAILGRVEQDPRLGYTVGLTLAAGWSDWGRASLPPELVGPAARLLVGSLGTNTDIGGWSALLESFAATCPSEAAVVATTAITTAGPARVVLQEDALRVLVTVAGKRPEAVMDAVGVCLLDEQRRLFFGILRFPGLFEAVGLPVLQKWIREHDPALVKYIARHLESPYVKNGTPFVPSVTEWFLTEYQGDERLFREFCAGRHSGEVLRGSARDRSPAVEAAVSPFLDHPLRRVRDWARYELAENEYEATLDDKSDERYERL